MAAIFVIQPVKSVSYFHLVLDDLLV